MSFGIKTSIEITGDRDLFERVANRLQNQSVLMERIGVLGVNRGNDRLAGVVDPGGISRGTLGASLHIMDVTDLSVTFGSNLPYAAQFQFGGTILPKTGTALAIPLTDQLKKAGLSPRDVDPSRELLEFIPSKAGGAGIGVLVDPGRELEGRQRKRRGSTPYGPGPLFALVRSVTQEPHPFLGFDKEDVAEVEKMYKEWLEEQ
ncbi:MAG: hypothetical protein ACE5E5_08495 [Phycisphaerae bacterium]